MLIEKMDFDLRVAVEETVGLLAERAYNTDLEAASAMEANVPMALRGDCGALD